MYIVTGAAGLIGSGVVWGLNQRGIEDILLVDHLGQSDKWKNLRALRYSDYEEKDDFRELILHGAFDDTRIEAIIHMGACSATTERDATYLIDNNFNYTQELAGFASAHGIRFIYASSCATYGDGSLGYYDNEDELERLRPMNMYGYSKHMFDLWARRKGLLKEITGLKFSNVYGCNELHKGDMRSVVCRAYEQISAEGKMRLFKSYRPEYADGEQKRDFIYIKDAVDMIMFLLDKPDSHGIYNIGSGRAETWNELAAAAFAALDKKINIEYIDMPDHLRDRYQYYTKAEMTKLRSLGYEREVTSLKDAVSDYIRNYISQEKYLGD
ncbi:ADP-glyceromanno-heptose 6-epimerase [Lentisphaerota bacterium ZTH]|nr:ADP-glyceromanno-heptose 6-epimerase [Lentisphaerota bacterium]WET05572.1 ADP-glyceromanno-heptose 6-epimerase [Lentisphaerota bacterium ZTH]